MDRMESEKQRAEVRLPKISFPSLDPSEKDLESFFGTFFYTLSKVALLWFLF